MPDPVVGWLVAHGGPALGTDFRIRWGQNPIGANKDQAIHVPDDKAIHGAGHAFVTYDPEDNRFWLTPGTQRGLVRANGQLVTQAVELQPYDVIKLGESLFTFVPLCGPSFVWSFQKDQASAPL